MTRLLLIVMMMWTVAVARAQDDPEYRMEVGVGAGLSGYVGDFNNSLVKNLQPMFSAVARYNFDPYMGLRLNVSYATMKGTSENAVTYYPDYAGTPYVFDNKCYTAAVTYEYNFWPYGTGRDYRGAKRITPFVFGGIGGAYVATPDKGRFTLDVPVGVGVKYRMGERLNLGLEWGFHLTGSDMLDGVKDPSYVPSSGLFKNTDCYTALQFTVTYSFMEKCTTCNKE